MRVVIMHLCKNIRAHGKSVCDKLRIYPNILSSWQFKRVHFLWIAATWLLVQSFVGCSAPPKEENSELPNEIKFKIGGLVADSLQPPLVNRNNSGSFFYNDKPSAVRIEFPSGREWKRTSMITFVRENDGIILSATLTPLKKSIGFIDALLFLKNDAIDLGVKDNSTFESWVSKLETSPPEWSPFSSQSSGFDVEENVSFYVEIKPSSNRDEWYLSYSFDYATTKGGSGVAVEKH